MSSPIYVQQNVEDMIAGRSTKTRMDWLVRWKGFGAKDNTGEPLAKLRGCETFIGRFNKEWDKKKKEAEKEQSIREAKSEYK